MTGLFALLALAVVAGALTDLLRRYAARHNLIDIPGERSSHTQPTPRGGGMAIVVVFLTANILLGTQELLEWSTVGVMVGCGLMVACVGFWDDHRGLHAYVRLAVHTLAASAALSVVGHIPSLPLGPLSIETGTFGLLVGVVAIVWLLNLYNFMDGIDGIAAAEAITVTCGAAAILWFQDSRILSFWLLTLACACAGFLAWNWPPAKIFMGDGGSGFLGFALGVMALTTSASGSINLWCWLILLGVFVVDATFTLFRRLLRGQKWHEAHRSHGYQIAARRWHSHLKVTTAIILINVFWLLPIAWLAAIWQSSGALFLALAYSPLIALALSLGAGKDDVSCSDVPTTDVGESDAL